MRIFFWIGIKNGFFTENSSYKIIVIVGVLILSDKKIEGEFKDRV